MKFAYDIGIVAAEQSHFDSAEIELAHSVGRRITLVIVRPDVLPAMLDAGSDEGSLGRVVVTGHERVDVAAVPGGHLIVEDLANRVGRGLGKTSSGEEENGQTAHRVDSSRGTISPSTPPITVAVWRYASTSPVT